MMLVIRADSQSRLYIDVSHVIDCVYTRAHIRIRVHTHAYLCMTYSSYKCQSLLTDY